MGNGRYREHGVGLDSLLAGYQALEFCLIVWLLFCVLNLSSIDRVQKPNVCGDGDL
jgi:hypothetical protein